MPSTLECNNLWVNQSLAATVRSPWIDARKSRSLNLQFSVTATGTPVGALTLEESNDPALRTQFDRAFAANGNSTSDAYVAVPVQGDTLRVSVSGTGLAVSGANNTVIHIVHPAAFVRVVYTRTSGTSTAAQLWASGRT
jgi:hypothetical protein